MDTKTKNIITKTVKRLRNYYYLNKDEAIRYIKKSDHPDFFTKREEWSSIGYNYTEKKEETDWLSDHEAHWLLSRFVNFVLTDWINENSLSLALNNTNGNELKNVIDRVILEFMESWSEQKNHRE